MVEVTLYEEIHGHSMVKQISFVANYTNILLFVNEVVEIFQTQIVPQVPSEVHW